MEEKPRLQTGPGKSLVEMCSHLATERAGMGTFHLAVDASRALTQPQRKRGVTDRRNLLSIGQTHPRSQGPIHPKPMEPQTR
jgi:hypothetical protein